MIDGKIVHRVDRHNDQCCHCTTMYCAVGPISAPSSTFYPFQSLSSAPLYHSPRPLSAITLQMIYTKLKHAHVETSSLSYTVFTTIQDFNTDFV
jgi:hypothetical protein